MSLLLGPVLRRITHDQATVWVQTTQPATVEVRAGQASGADRTFCAFGRHFALVIVAGLAPDSTTPYQVLLDGEQAWPPPEYQFPPPVIRTRPPEAPVRLVFGSCREGNPYTHSSLPPDALDAFAQRLAREQTDWPDCLVLLGDQVYADETSPVTRSWLRHRHRRRRRPDGAPADQVVDFTEYAGLYLESWSDPEIRWLLSTVPSVMIFDDHEIIDDWNTSATWRADMARVPWWRRRIAAGLASYWIFQHLGNLDPAALAEDPVYAAVRGAPDATQILEQFGTRADADPQEYRWSYTISIGRTRLVVLDNRCGRQLEPGKRAMLPDGQWEWFTDLARAGGYDHLVIGSSLPWLLPPAIHDLERTVERLAEAPNPRVAALAERVRRALDLEHWAAFGRSFDQLTEVLTELASGGPEDGAPASISVLSGDVHHSYAARPDLGPRALSPVHQLTCSPVHNRVPAYMRPVFRLAWDRRGARLGRRVARLAGSGWAAPTWRRLTGPYFGNAVGVLVHDGRRAVVSFEGTDAGGDLRRIAEVRLAGE
jgi:PhoD-like phosphatase